MLAITYSSIPEGRPLQRLPRGTPSIYQQAPGHGARIAPRLQATESVATRQRDVVGRNAISQNADTDGLDAGHYNLVKGSF